MVCSSRVQLSLLREGSPDMRERRKSSLVRWRTGHCHWLRRLTRQLKSPKGQLQETWSNITDYNADLPHANRKYSRTGCRKRYCAWKFFSNIAKLLTAKHEQKKSCKQLPSRVRCDCRFPNRLSQNWAWFFPCFTVCAHQTRIVVYKNQYRYN